MNNGSMRICMGCCRDNVLWCDRCDPEECDCPTPLCEECLHAHGTTDEEEDEVEESVGEERWMDLPPAPPEVRQYVGPVHAGATVPIGRARRRGTVQSGQAHEVAA